MTNGDVSNHSQFEFLDDHWQLPQAEVQECLGQPVPQIVGPVSVAATVWIGSTRLIDNLRCRPERC